VIEAVGLTKRYGPSRGIEGISFSIGRGEIVGLLGPNGAGKSTTIRILTSYLPPTAGTARIAGHDTLSESREARRHVGYLPENVPLYPELRVEEYLRYRAALKDVPGRDRARRIDVAIDRCRLGDVRTRIAGHLSKGYRQRLGLAGALVSDPPVLILDEPTVGLDPNQVLEMRSLVRELAADRTILLSTHILPEVEAICSRVLVVAEGRLVADESMASLLGAASNDRSRVRVLVRAADAGLDDRLRAVAGVEAVVAEPDPEPGASRRRIDVAPGVDAREPIHAAIVAGGGIPLELSTVRASLEDVFGNLTRVDTPVALARPVGGNGSAA
jgi:ABC-2 type transport system ATP-binding protein